jgi:hypothetical protein
VRTTHKIRIEVLGIDAWEIMEGHTYAALETRKMTVKVHDENRVVREIQVEGDRSLANPITLVRSKFDIPAWNSVRAQRIDGKPFSIGDRGQRAVLVYRAVYSKPGHP